MLPSELGLGVKERSGGFHELVRKQLRRYASHLVQDLGQWAQSELPRERRLGLESPVQSLAGLSFSVRPCHPGIH